MKNRNRNYRKDIAVVLLAFLLAATLHQPAASQQNAGQELYRRNCARCHGADGTKGMFGARNLQRSRLADSDITERIMKGKGIMPSFGKKLSTDEISQLMRYTRSLRTE